MHISIYIRERSSAIAQFPPPRRMVSGVLATKEPQRAHPFEIRFGSMRKSVSCTGHTTRTPAHALQDPCTDIDCIVEDDADDANPRKGSCSIDVRFNARQTVFRVVGGLILIVKWHRAGRLFSYLFALDAREPGFCVRARVPIYIQLKIYCFALINMNDKIYKTHMHASHAPHTVAFGTQKLENILYARECILVKCIHKRSGLEARHIEWAMKSVYLLHGRCSAHITFRPRFHLLFRWMETNII